MSTRSLERSPFREEMPLNGRVLPGLGITERDGIRVVRWPNHFIEYDYHQVVESEIHPDNPRIGIVRAYHIPEGLDTRTASLEDVRVENNPPMLFLISKRDDQFVVITSRMHRDQEGMVIVRPPKYGPGGSTYDGSVRHVEMFDAPRTLTESDLVEMHKRRIGSPWDRDFTSFWEQKDVDELFLYMAYD